ncbi:MAG TPA: tRNA (adenosine(37)-N6)-threonylcarbamoyltransferase complex dimerization subunit type 1 TsaB [Gemmatimonadales bacterium]
MRLAIETATDRLSVALGHSAVDAVARELPGARRHAAALLPLVQELLDSAGASLDAVRAVVLADGPGSFTGLRVGASVAKALAHARGLALWTAPSLLIRACGVARPGHTVLALADALRGDVYAAAYRFDGARIEELRPPGVCRPAELTADSFRPDILVGEVPAPAAQVLEAWAARAIIGPPAGAPHARVLLDLPDRPGGATPVAAVEAWEPSYGRPAEAQVRWESSHGRPLPDSVRSRG